MWIDLCSLISETSERNKICRKHFKIGDFNQDFGPLSNIDEVANSDGPKGQLISKRPYEKSVWTK